MTLKRICVQYIMKLSRRERVIDEVKKALRPFYSRRQITKDDYKDVLRKAVPKVCTTPSFSDSDIIQVTLVTDYCASCAGSCV